jgi:hypothetical protein
VLRTYVDCCRRDQSALNALIAELDRLSPSPVFAEHYARLSSEPGFPRFRATGGR